MDARRVHGFDGTMVAEYERGEIVMRRAQATVVLTINKFMLINTLTFLPPPPLPW